MRVTTHGSLLTYKSGLMRSGNMLDAARNKVLTQRNFNSYAEDPASATQAFKLRRLHSRTSDQISTSSSLVAKFESAWTSTGKVSNLLESAAKEVALRGGTDSTAAGRQPLGQVLDSTAESIVQNLNAQYGGSFVFAGSNGDKAPFSWDPNTKELLFQGISVDAGLPGAPAGAPPKPSDVAAGTPWGDYYTANPDYAKLVTMSQESVYGDIGAGLYEDGATGELNQASVFNGAISGLNILGFGTDADGDPKNAVSLIKELAGIFNACDPDSGAYADPTGDPAKVNRLTKKLEGALGNITNEFTKLDGQAEYLKTNKERLETTADTLNQQILGLEQVNLADAITEFSWAQFCYNSALKVGNSVLSQSLIDFMR